MSNTIARRLLGETLNPLGQPEMTRRMKAQVHKKSGQKVADDTR